MLSNVPDKPTDAVLTAPAPQTPPNVALGKKQNNKGNATQENHLRTNVNNLAKVLRANYSSVLSRFDEGKKNFGVWTEGLNRSVLTSALNGQESLDNAASVLKILTTENDDLGKEVFAARILDRLIRALPETELASLIDLAKSDKPDSEFMKSLGVSVFDRNSDQLTRLAAKVREFFKVDLAEAPRCEAGKLSISELDVLLDVPAFLDRVIAHQSPDMNQDALQGYGFHSLNSKLSDTGVKDGKQVISGPVLQGERTLQISEERQDGSFIGKSRNVISSNLANLFGGVPTNTAAAVLLTNEDHEVLVLRDSADGYSLYDPSEMRNNNFSGFESDSLDSCIDKTLSSFSDFSHAANFSIKAQLYTQGTATVSKPEVSGNPPHLITKHGLTNSTKAIKHLLSAQANILFEQAKTESRYTDVSEDQWTRFQQVLDEFRSSVSNEKVTPFLLIRINEMHGGPANNCGDPDSAGTHTQENILQNQLVNEAARQIGFTEKKPLVSLHIDQPEQRKAQGTDFFFNAQKPLSEINTLKQEITTRTIVPVPERTPSEVATLEGLRHQKANVLDYWGQISGRPGAGKEIAADQAALLDQELHIIEGENLEKSRAGKVWFRNIDRAVNDALSKREQEQNRHAIREKAGDATPAERPKDLFIHFQGPPGQDPTKLQHLPEKVRSFAQDFTNVTSIPSELIVLRGEPAIKEQTSAEPSYVGSADVTKDGSMDYTHVRQLLAILHLGKSEILEKPLPVLPLTKQEQQNLGALDDKIKEIDSGMLNRSEVLAVSDEISNQVRALVLDRIDDSELRVKLENWLEFTDMLNEHNAPRLQRVSGYPYGGIRHLDDSLINSIRAIMVQQGPRALNKSQIDQFEQAAINKLATAMTKHPENVKGFVSSGGTSGNDIGLRRGLAVAAQLDKDAKVFGSSGAHYSFDKINKQFADAKKAGDADMRAYEGHQTIPLDTKGRVNVQSMVDAVVTYMKGDDENHSDDLAKSGKFPVIFMTFGTTNAGAMDPVKELVYGLEEKGVSRGQFSIHMDGAYSLGMSQVGAEFQEVFDKHDWRFGFDSEPVDPKLSPKEQQEAAVIKAAEPRYEWGTILDVVDSVSISGHKALATLTPAQKICSYILYKGAHDAGNGQSTEVELKPLEEQRDVRVAEFMSLGLELGGLNRARSDLMNKIEMSTYFTDQIRRNSAKGGPLEGMYWVANNNTIVLPRIKDPAMAYKWGTPHNSRETHFVIQAHHNKAKLDAAIEEMVTKDIFGVSARNEAHARRLEGSQVTNAQMEEHFEADTRAFLSQGINLEAVRALMPDLDTKASVEDVAKRIKIEVYNADVHSDSVGQSIDRLLSQSIMDQRAGLAGALSDRAVAKDTGLKLMSQEGLELVMQKARKYTQGENLNIVMRYQPNSNGSWVTCGAALQYEEGLTARNPADRSQFQTLVEHQIADQEVIGNTIKKRDEFKKEVFDPILDRGETWITGLKKGMSRLNFEELIYSSVPITNQRSIGYVFASGMSDSVKNSPLENLMTRAIDKQFEVKNFDAAFTELSSASLINGKDGWADHMSNQYKDTLLWQYRRQDGNLDIRDKRLTAEEMKTLGYETEEKITPFKDVDFSRGLDENNSAVRIYKKLPDESFAPTKNDLEHLHRTLKFAFPVRTNASQV